MIFYILKHQTIFSGASLSLKRPPHKMVKHTQTIRWQFADKLFGCV